MISALRTGTIGLALIASPACAYDTITEAFLRSITTDTEFEVAFTEEVIEANEITLRNVTLTGESETLNIDKVTIYDGTVRTGGVLQAGFIALQGVAYEEAGGWFRTEYTLTFLALEQVRLSANIGAEEPLMLSLHAERTVLQGLNTKGLLGYSLDHLDMTRQIDGDTTRFSGELRSNLAMPIDQQISAFEISGTFDTYWHASEGRLDLRDVRVNADPLGYLNISAELFAMDGAPASLIMPEMAQLGAATLEFGNTAPATWQHIANELIASEESPATNWIGLLEHNQSTSAPGTPPLPGFVTAIARVLDGDAEVYRLEFAPTAPVRLADSTPDFFDNAEANGLSYSVE